MESLRHIGYWRGDSEPSYPDPQDFVDTEWNEEERRKVGRYLWSGTTLAASAGLSECRICGRANGSLEFTDGTFVWPQGLSHYVEEHHVRLPTEVIEHAIRAMDSYEARAASDVWWRDAMQPL